MKAGFRLHDEHDHPELNGKVGRDLRLWLNAHMLKAHLERLTLKGTEETARRRHATLHAEMAMRAQRWADANDVEVPRPGTDEARAFELSLIPPKARPTAKKSKKTPKKNSYLGRTKSTGKARTPKPTRPHNAKCRLCGQGFHRLASERKSVCDICAPPPSSSVRTVSGGLPGLGRRR
jgi:asparagine synthetase B (glutamine-hydrolysing)